MSPLAQSCLAANSWICGEYVSSRQEELTTALLEHVTLTIVSVVGGFLLAFPLALLARGYRRTQTPVLGVTTAIYTIPSLAMFSLLVPFTGISPTTVVVGLMLYSLTILIRNIITGLDGVPDDVRESAKGMGYGSARLLFSVEVPLALPTIMAGVRVATVSTVALVTIGAIVDNGGLGNLIYEGLGSAFKAQVLTASVLCVVLAILFDVLLLGTQRVMTPWQRRAA